MSSNKATIACLTGAGTAPELMAEAVRALDAVARLHGLSHRRGARAVRQRPRSRAAGRRSPRRRATPCSPPTRCSSPEPRSRRSHEVMAELDLRARVTRVRFGHDDDVALVAPLDESASEWALERAFELAERRRLRLASVGDGDWIALADSVAERYDHVHVEHLSPRMALPLAAFQAGRFDVVAVAPGWAEARRRDRRRAGGRAGRRARAARRARAEPVRPVAGRRLRHRRPRHRQPEQHAARRRARARARARRAGRRGDARRRGLGRARRRPADAGSPAPRRRRDEPRVHRPRRRRLPAVELRNAEFWAGAA